MLFPMLLLMLCLVLNPFDKLISEVMQKYQIPAAAMAVSKNSELIHTKGYGAPGDVLFVRSHAAGHEPVHERARSWHGGSAQRFFVFC